MSRLINRLRAAADLKRIAHFSETIFNEAADEIERLTAKVEELDSALAGHAKIDHCHGDEDGVPCVSHLAYLDVINNEGGAWVTSEQIDAAVSRIGTLTGSSRPIAWIMLNYFDIKRCPSTGCHHGVYTEGNDDGSMTTTYPCQCCSRWGSKGWVIKKEE